jgi:hypothetical protein
VPPGHIDGGKPRALVEPQVRLGGDIGKCYNPFTVDAPCEQVWAAISDFHDLSWAPQVITDVTAVGERRADQLGAQRILDGVFYETLVTHDPLNKTLTYRIEDGPSPVAKHVVRNYIGMVRVLPITASNQSFVEWESTYDSADDGSVSG